MNKNKLPPKIKLTVIPVIWFLIIVTWALMLLGCASNKTYDLLYEDELKNLAYKSVTEKDYKDNEDECEQTTG